MSTRARRLVLTLAATAVLALVFAAYLQPGLAFAVANQLWACF